jgi:hypothetical protein
MCHVVVVSVTGYAGDATEPFLGRGLVTASSSNPTCSALPAKSVKFEVTAGGCSCGFCGEHSDEVFNVERERRRYRRKGWSENKIEKKVASLKMEHETRPRKHGRDQYGFVDAIEKLARSGAKVTLLSHFFDGSFDEPFEIVGSTELPLQHFLDMGGGFPGDRLVTIVA